MAAIGILRPIAGAPILDEIIAAGLQVVVEQMPKGNPGKLADMRGIVECLAEHAGTTTDAGELAQCHALGETLARHLTGQVEHREIEFSTLQVTSA